MDKGALSYEKYKNGDDQGFYEIVREYFDGLAAYINGIVGDFCRAEELADDTLLKLAIKRPNFDGRSSFKTWLFSIGRNIAYDSLRKKSPPPSLSLEETAETEDGPEQAYIKDERNKIIYKALDGLKPEYREVLWLTYFEGMSAEQTAKVLRKSKAAVYTLLNRAKNSLKEKLVEEGFDNEIV